MTITTVPTFTLDSLVASVPGSGTPCTQFANGADIQLSWNSTGTQFTVYAAQDPEPVYSGTASSCVISGGRSRTTTFVVAAEVTGGVQSGTPDTDFENLYLYDALTVTITDPDETPRSVTAGAVAVTGPSTLQSVVADNAVVSGGLTVAGAAGLDGGAQITNLTVTGDANLQGTTTVTGGRVGGSFNVTGSLTSNEFTATDLTVLDTTRMMSYQSISPGTWFRCTSDGILAGTVWWPSDSGVECAAIIRGFVEGQPSVSATGGNMVAYISGSGLSSLMCSNGNTFAVPVPKNQAFQTAVYQMDKNKVAAPTAFWFVPLSLNAKLSSVSDGEAAALAEQIAARPAPSTATVNADDRSAATAEVVAAVREMVGDNVSDDAAAQFAAAVRSLFPAA